MRYYIDYNDGARDEKLKPESWMLEALAMNYHLNLWTPYDGYIDMHSSNSDWPMSLIFKSWEEFFLFGVTICNQIVNFYFEIHKNSSSKTRCSLGLALWAIHPGSSYLIGFHIKKIQKDDLNSVIQFLKQADDFNRERFSKLV